MKSAAFIREAMSKGRPVTGMIGFMGHPMVVEIMASAGIDFVVLDMEHCPLGLEELAHLIRAADAAGIAPLVRVPEVDDTLIKKILNLGASGIVIPHANPENCAAAVRASRYAPDGTRGACPITRASRYWPEDWNQYAARMNRDVMVIPLIEDAEVLDDLDSLLKIDGIDVIFVGPYDLSVSIGCPGAAFDHPDMGAALDRVISASEKYGKAVMTTVGDRQEPEYARSILERGVKSVVFATDALVFLQSCKRLNKIKEVWPST